MTFQIQHAAKMISLPPIEINTVEDLKKIAERHQCQLILDFSTKTITIYDDYIES